MNGNLEIAGQLPLSDNALVVLKKRYLKKNDEGAVEEEAADMFRRVAGTIAQVDLKYDPEADVDVTANKFYDLMAELYFLPNSPTLMNAGRELGQLSACFVLPVDDSIDSIFDAIKHTAIIHKSGGGTGFSFSRIRPANDPVMSTKGVASGPLSFMNIFDVATETIKQGGTRRGANMAILRCISGETWIHTVSGKVKIKNLVGQRPYLYACDPESRQVHVVQADSVFVSDYDRQLVRVWFDNDDYLDCTPDHLLMMVDGSYDEAAALQVGQSLMAFEKRIVQHGTSKRFVYSIGCTGRKSRYEHRVVLEDILCQPVGNDWHGHHKDGDSLNNTPKNLEAVSRSDHAKYHNKNLIANQQKIAQSRKGKTLEELYGPERAANWREKLSKARKKNNGAIGNHRVVKVESIGISAEVYDISLPQWHNFVANGVFVHNCDHPDIERFITCKNDTERLTNFNISVGVTDAFMEAVKAEADFPLINPRTGEEVKTVKARALFDLIVESAWGTGEPGIIFLDAINRNNTLPNVGEIESTNPCGEQPLFPYESCNLGSLNLSKVVKDGEIDWALLKETVHTAVHFLDNVIDANKLPLEAIKESTLANRKIGLGVMGFADLLLALGIPYNTDEAVAVGEEIMAFINKESKTASADLAAKRGNFQNFPGSSYESNGLARMRNATTTTIAPTGTISIIAGCSSGIEPLFAVSYVRRVLEGTEMVEVHPYFEELAKRRGFYSAELMRQIAQTGSIRSFKEIPKDVRRLFVTAHEVSPQWHIRLQAAFQKYTDNAVSKTVNFPNQATPDDVRQVYFMAYENGLKGVTIYRDGSRDQQVLSFGANPKKLEHIAPRPRPERTTGVTDCLTTGCGKLYVTVNKDDLGFCEVFAQMGKTGGCASSQIESTGRLISLALRAGVKIESIIKQITGIRCPSPVWGNGKQVLSCPDAIAKVLAGVSKIQETDQDLPTMGACPDCGGAMEREGGCMYCKGCGFSRC